MLVLVCFYDLNWIFLPWNLQTFFVNKNTLKQIKGGQYEGFTVILKPSTLSDLHYDLLWLLSQYSILIKLLLSSSFFFPYTLDLWSLWDIFN